MPSPVLLRTLRVDLMTAEVMAALEAARLEAILLRGPAIARELYDREGERTYADCDLLVPGAHRAGAEQVLDALGFQPESVVPAHLAPPAPLRDVRAQHWRRRRDGAEVDLHRTLFGLAIDEGWVWSEFSSGRRAMTLAGGEVTVPSRSALALVIVLHALQHRDNLNHPLRDLEQAVRRWELDVWREARALADRLDAAAEFAAGLTQVPAGGELALRLGLHHPPDRLARAARAADHRERVQWRSARLSSVADASSLRAWLAVGRRLILPTVALRAGDPQPGQRGGTLAAYVRRELALANGAPSVLRSWWRARRRSR